MSHQWIDRTEHALKRLERLKTATQRDRLEVIIDLYRIIEMLNRSVHSWHHWIQNWSFMAQFTEEELNAIKQRLIDLTENVLQYILEASKQYANKEIDGQSDDASEDVTDEPNENAHGLYA